MARRRRHQEEHENLERWLVSYADFITLLFAFFVVMYAVSSVNEGKYRVLSETLNEVFTVTPSSDDPIQVVVTERADGLAIALDEQLRAGVRAVDHRGEGDGPLGPEGIAPDLVQRRAAHQSSSSMKRWIVPPQVRPTANASSSE